MWTRIASGYAVGSNRRILSDVRSSTTSPRDDAVLVRERARRTVRVEEREAHMLTCGLLDGARALEIVEFRRGEPRTRSVDLDACRLEVRRWVPPTHDGDPVDGRRIVDLPVTANNHLRAPSGTFGHLRALLLSKQLSQRERGLGRDPGHFAKTIIREILRLAFFDSLQNEAGDEFGLVTLGVMSRGSATCWIAHPVLTEVRRRDVWVDFADDDAILFQLGACGETKAKKRTLRRRVNTVLRKNHESSSRVDVYDASAAFRPHHRNHSLYCHNWSQDIEMEDFVKKRRFDLLYCGRIATACIVYETVDPAVMLVYSAYGFPHSIKLRDVYRER
jgi:hypothetical protein